MRKDRILSFIRHTFSCAGGVLFAFALLNGILSPYVLGGGLIVMAILWSCFEKQGGLERFEGILRHLLTAIGSFVSTHASLSSDRTISVVMGVAVVAVIYLGQLDKMKRLEE